VQRTLKPDPNYLDAPPTVADGTSTFEITSNAATGGYIIPQGTKIKNIGENVPYTFAANSGYEIDQVFIDGTPNATAKVNGYYLFSNITANHSIVVTFKVENTGIEENPINNKLTLFPNPTQSEIFIQTNLKINKVEVYAITGSLITSENNFNGKLSVANLTTGIYLVKVYTDEGIAVKKIVKE